MKNVSILHRYPVVTPDPYDWEVEMWDLEEKLDNKHREWFIEKMRDSKSPYAIPEKNPTIEEILASLPFTPAPRVTEAGLKNAL